MLYSAIHWPKQGLVSDLIDGINKFIKNYLDTSDIYLVFDRYFSYSIKSDTRKIRVGSLRRNHFLSLTSVLPAKDICLSSVKTKENLIELISSELLRRYAIKEAQHFIIITSKSKYPEEVHAGVRITRQDLATELDEADYIICHQVDSAIQEGKTVVRVFSSDTDVFVMLCNLYKERKWFPAEVYMDDFQRGKSFISIKETTKRHSYTSSMLIPVHALSGCDSVPMMFGIGKVKVLGILKDHPLQHLGRADANEEDVMQEAKEFVAACYGGKNVSSSANRWYI